MPIVFIATPNPGTGFAAMMHDAPDPRSLNFYYGKYNYFSDVPADVLYKRRTRILARGFLRPRNWFLVAGYYRAFLNGIRTLGARTLLRYLPRHGRPREAFVHAVQEEAAGSLAGPVAPASKRNGP